MALFLFDFRHREDNFYQNVGRRTQIWRRRWESCLEHSPVHAHIHTHWRTLCLSGEVPILNVSYKPQTISPKFKVRLFRLWCTLSQETQRLGRVVSWQQVIKMLITSRVKDEVDCLTFVCTGQRQSFAAREDPRCLHPPTVHHRRHEADADREHHWPGRKTSPYNSNI